MRRSRKIILVTSAIAVVLVGLGYGFWYVSVRPWGELSRKLEATSTDAPEYPSILAKWQPSGMVAHFPPVIPPQATNVWFYEYPGALQGHGDLELKLQLPPAQIEMIEASAKKLSTGVPQQDRLLPFFRVLGSTTTREADVPSEVYTTYFLNKVTSTVDENSAGITISRSRNEVIYWATWR